jgi:hypothetical protein
MKKKNNPNEKVILINAQSEIYSVFEYVKESKCVKRLVQVRNNFVQLLNSRRYPSCTLTVKTSIVNPELFS